MRLNFKKLRHFPRFFRFLSAPVKLSGLSKKRLGVGIVFFILYMLVLASNFVSSKISLEIGQVSERDVVAPRTISYINVAETKKLEQEILAGVANVYDKDTTVMSSTEGIVRKIFQVCRQVLVSRVAEQVDDSPDKVPEVQLSVTQKIEQLKKDMPIALANNVLEALVDLNEIELIKTEDNIKFFLYKYYLERGIRKDEVESVKLHIATESEKLDLSNNEKTVVSGITQQLIKPNYIYNAVETQRKKEAALDAMEPVRNTVKKEQVLVRRGDIITLEQVRVMEELGLYSGSINQVQILGMAIFVIMIMVITVIYLRKFARQVYKNLKYVFLLGLIILISLIISKLAIYYSDFAAPLAAGCMLAAILLDAKIGLFVCVILSMFFGVISDNNLRAVITGLFGSMAGVYSIAISPRGHSLARAGLFVAAANFCLIGATGLIAQIDTVELLTEASYGMFSGIASAVLAIGLLPYLENTFNITSSVKLMDLARPNHPLLQRLLFDAPGTYHHSILVGNMAEAAASKIGANTVLVRVGAYYHDVGKIKRPYFFVENQIGGENPHEKMAPYLSTLVITSHIKDGVELCQEYKLPQVIIDIVQQHHGTTLASFFYHKAVNSEHGKCVSESDFRYEGPCPQTKEVALIMLADACEAAVRSINKPTYGRVETMVKKIIKGRLDEGQLDECNLTLKDLDTIGDVFIRILASMFHSRIEYPATIKELEKGKAKKEDNQNGNNNKQPTGQDAGETNQGDEPNSNSGAK